jgi:Ca2+-transporting ATPase
MPPSRPLHAESAAEALARLDTDPSGLSDVEAERRLRHHGPNRLVAARPVSALAILRDQLTSIVVWLLVAAAAISLILGERVEALAIGVVLLMNALIGFITELRARRAMEALLQYDVPRALVIRGGRLRTIAAEALVPGDIVQLDAGHAVPADARVIAETDLRVVEAALTGESLPVSKEAEVVLPDDTPMADRVNMVYKGTTVAAGTGHAVVSATGAGTELGRIGALVGGLREERTPLERRLDTLGRRLVWLALGVAALVAALGAWQGAPLGLVIEMGIALAVAAVPEALPAVATIALAVGLRRMARANALVRRLPAVEALGSTTVICTDKTRTLTSGDMTVVRLWIGGDEIDLRADRAGSPAAAGALEIAALASRPQATGPGDEGRAGDPVDVAMLEAAARHGVDRAALARDRPHAGLVPFSSERKFLASFHQVGGTLVAYVKGAPRTILSICDKALTTAGEIPLDEPRRHELIAANERLAGEGLRVLALASGAVPAATERAVRGLTFAGYAGLMDPPARGVRETIARLRRAGLRTIMLTGDQRLTAEAVGRELGVLSGVEEAIDGAELDRLTEDQLVGRVERIGAFSRITPEHKLSIVRALQTRGEIVAMLGDGVNDAAALKKADVGVAMGIRGTDVAKEAAAVVLQDDRFETVAAAVEQGRVIYDNIRKFVFYLFSCNVAEILVLLLAGLAGLPLPLLPLQILWLNIVTDTFPALALAMEPGDVGVMSRPPRDPQEAILSRPFLGSILFYGLLITAATLAAFAWALARAPERATTISFMTLALAQVLHLGNARSVEPVLRPSRAAANVYALAAVALSIGLQLAALYVPPLREVLDLVVLRPVEWGVAVALGAVPAVIGQAIKTWRASRR